MSRMKDGCREKKCGCLVFEVGPPVLCATHQQKAVVAEEKAIRSFARERAWELGHDLSDLKEYPSCDGKWVAHCHACGAMLIVYDRIPARGDQVAGGCLTKQCGGGHADADAAVPSELQVHDDDPTDAR